MTTFFHWRKMTWALVLWGAAMTALPLISTVGATSVGVLWFVGMIGLVPLWHATQPLFRQGHGLRGLFVRPGPGHWRVANLHLTYWATEPRRDAD